MVLSDRVIERRPEDLIWRFGSKPCYAVGSYHTYVDPTPCYSHDHQIVEETLKLVEKRVDILCKPAYYVLSHEPEERTNGWAQTYAKYPKPEDPAEAPWDGYVILAGKRIPPHPAMTRYLVAHEYGHHAEYDVLRQRGLEAHHKEVEAEYAKVRGLPGNPHYYGPGTWHITRAEVFANDFRILVCGVEEEFWPHEAPHPRKLTAAKRRKLMTWWRKNLAVE